MKTVNKKRGECDVECDMCGAVTTIYETNYSDISRAMKNEGWIIKHDNGEFYDICPKCKEAV